MKVYVIFASAHHNEVDGKSRFVHKRAFLDKTKAEEFMPKWAKEIKEDESRIITYCEVKPYIQELELVE